MKREDSSFLAAENAELREQLAEANKTITKLKRRLKAALGIDPRDRLIKVLREKGSKRGTLEQNKTDSWLRSGGEPED